MVLECNHRRANLSANQVVGGTRMRITLKIAHDFNKFKARRGAGEKESERELNRRKCNNVNDLFDEILVGIDDG